MTEQEKHKMFTQLSAASQIPGGLVLDKWESAHIQKNPPPPPGFETIVVTKAEFSLAGKKHAAYALKLFLCMPVIEAAMVQEFKKSQSSN